MKGVILTTLAILVFASNVLGEDPDPSKYSTAIRRFIDDVCFVVDAGDQERYTKKLPNEITFAFQGGAAELKATTSNLISELADAAGLRTEVTDDVASATITFYFGQSKQLEDIAKKLEKEISLENGTHYWTWWGEDRIVTRGVVFLCVDIIRDKAEQTDALLENLLGVFGVPSRSDEIEASCLNAADPTLLKLQPVDRALLHFLYSKVPPGTRPAEMGKIVREHW